MRGYSFVDYATQGYLAIVAALILCFHGQNVPHWGGLVLGHLIVLGIIHCLIVSRGRQPAKPVLAFLGHFYPVLLYAGFYAETGALNQMFVRGYLDPVVIGWDQALFGCQPSLVFMQKLPYLGVSEVFYAAYFSYYLMIGGVGLTLYLKDRHQFFHFVSVVSFVFYVCYLIYIVLPVIGPPVFFGAIPGYSLPASLQHFAALAQVPPSIQSGLFYQVMKWIYKVFEAPGAAIPSSHVAVAFCTVFFSFRYIRSIRWWHLGLAVLLCLATVYCHYHYVSDVFAGAAAAFLLIPAANWLFLKSDSGGVSAPPGCGRAMPVLKSESRPRTDSGAASEY